MVVVSIERHDTTTGGNMPDPAPIQSPRNATCARPTCGLPIHYITGPSYGRWVHDHNGRWQCADYGPGDAQNNQAYPGNDYYRIQVPPTTSPLHRDEPGGADPQGRMHGASAVRRLLNATPVGPPWNHGAPENLWTAADDAVAQADQETKDAALRHLFALHMHELTAAYPTVAMRNVKSGDVVTLHGADHTVVEKTGDGQRGHVVNLQVVFSPARGVDHSKVFAYEGDVRIPLKHRVSAEMGQRLFTEILDASHSCQSEDRGGYVRGLEKAFCMLTGESEDVLYDQIQEALQARHEEQIAAEEGYENL